MKTHNCSLLLEFIAFFVLPYACSYFLEYVLVIVALIILNNKEDDLHFSPVIFKKLKNLLQLKQREYLLDIKSKHKLMFPEISTG